MKQRLLALSLSLGTLCFVGTTAQAQVNETTVSVNKNQSNAFTTSFEAEQSAVENTVDAELKKVLSSSKSWSTKGFKVFKGVIWNAISTEKVDVYYKVESKKKISTVYLLVSKGYNNFVSTQNDPQMAANITAFLSNLSVKVKEYEHTKVVEEQTKKVKDAEDDYNKYIKRADELRKDKARIEKDIEENDKKLQERERELNNQKSRLEEVKR